MYSCLKIVSQFITVRCVSEKRKKKTQVIPFKILIRVRGKFSCFPRVSPSRSGLINDDAVEKMYVGSCRIMAVCKIAGSCTNCVVARVSN